MLPSLKLRQVCEYFDQQNVVEVTLCQFPGPGFKKLAASTSCPLENPLWMP